MLDGNDYAETEILINWVTIEPQGKLSPLAVKNFMVCRQ